MDENDRFNRTFFDVFSIFQNEIVKEDWSPLTRASPFVSKQRLPLLLMA